MPLATGRRHGSVGGRRRSTSSVWRAEWQCWRTRTRRSLRSSSRSRSSTVRRSYPEPPLTAQPVRFFPAVVFIPFDYVLHLPVLSPASASCRCVVLLPFWVFGWTGPPLTGSVGGMAVLGSPPEAGRVPGSPPEAGRVLGSPPEPERVPGSPPEAGEGHASCPHTVPESPPLPPPPSPIAAVTLSALGHRGRTCADGGSRPSWALYANF